MFLLSLFQYLLSGFCNSTVFVSFYSLTWSIIIFYRITLSVVCVFLTSFSFCIYEIALRSFSSPVSEWFPSGSQIMKVNELNFSNSAIRQSHRQTDRKKDRRTCWNVFKSWDNWHHIVGYGPLIVIFDSLFSIFPFVFLSYCVYMSFSCFFSCSVCLHKSLLLILDQLFPFILKVA
jgi:hypothetical protein